MGQTANASRRSLLAHVQSCIAQVNACTANIGEVKQAHNALVEQVKLDLARLERDGQNLSFDRLKLAQAHADAAVKKLDGDLLAHVAKVRGDLCFVLAPALWLTTKATIWQRLRWMLTGWMPTMTEIDES